MTKRRAHRLLALAAMIVFCGTAFRAGWNRAETDFPNYYTAAVLVRKGEPLRNYYDWTWFQRQMEYVGIEGQLGGYVPQTPLTMLPLLPLARYAPQTAKRIWLTLNMGFLLGAIFLLSRVTRFSVSEIGLLAFAGYGTLYSNFLLGQYYVFLLFVLVLAFYLLYRSNRYASGFVFGTAFALKLYGGPFLLYLVAKRDRRAVTGMIIGSLVLAVAAMAIFGWPDIVYFATHIVPRALQGETLDPYNAGNGTLSTLLRRVFLPEPELNPAPLWKAPGLFFFLQPFLTLAILIFPLLALRESNQYKARLRVVLPGRNVGLCQHCIVHFRSLAVAHRFVAGRLESSAARGPDRWLCSADGSIAAGLELPFSQGLATDVFVSRGRQALCRFDKAESLGNCGNIRDVNLSSHGRSLVWRLSSGAVTKVGANRCPARSHLFLISCRSTIRHHL